MLKVSLKFIVINGLCFVVMVCFRIQNMRIVDGKPEYKVGVVLMKNMNEIADLTMG
jgi:hypothetical protein